MANLITANTETVKNIGVDNFDAFQGDVSGVSARASKAASTASDESNMSADDEFDVDSVDASIDASPNSVNPPSKGEWCHTRARPFNVVCYRISFEGLDRRQKRIRFISRKDGRRNSGSQDIRQIVFAQSSRRAD